MATARKTKASKSKPRPKQAKAKAAGAKSTKKVAVKAAKKIAPHPPLKKAAPPVAKKPAAKVISKVVAKPAGKGAKGTKGGKGSRPHVPAEVRPLGVLPPSSMARPISRPPLPARPRPTPPAPVTPTPSGPGASRVTTEDLKEFEQRLLEERARIMKEMGHLETTVLKVNPRDSAGDLSGYAFHMADAGTDAMEREKAFQVASAEGRAMMEINEALRRLYRGEYGTCETCGQFIARARLEVMPYARLCVSCKEKEERAQRGAS